MTETDPHADRPIARRGAPLDAADAAVLMIHGRGATAGSIVRMAEAFEDGGPEDVAYLAPQAARNTWYPNSFLAPIESNEPWLSSALGRLEALLETVRDEGIPRERTMVIGFSQGACLGSEFVARNATRYGGLAALSGGLIGPEGTPRQYDGALDGTPVFLGCSDVDPHIPLERVEETTRVLNALGGDVTERIYEGMGHGVNADEVEYVSGMVANLLGE